MQLVVRNVGGGRPQGVDRAAHGNPGKLSFCFCEHPDSPFTTLAESRGATPGADALTVFAGEGPRCVVDQKSREPESLARSLAVCLQTVHHPKLVLGFDAMLVLGPEHGRVFAEAGWDRDRIARRADRRRSPTGCRARRAAPAASPRACPSGFADGTLPKFRPGGILLVLRGWRRRAVLGHHRWLGQRRHRQRTGHQRGTTMTTRYILDPTGERTVAERQRLDRPASIAGLTRRAARHLASRAATSSSTSSSAG